MPGSSNALRVELGVLGQQQGPETAFRSEALDHRHPSAVARQLAELTLGMPPRLC